jgi:hypothetical protein
VESNKKKRKKRNGKNIRAYILWLQSIGMECNIVLLFFACFIAVMAMFCDIKVMGCIVVMLCDGLLLL